MDKLEIRHLRFHISPHFCPASPLPRLLRVVSSVWPRIILQCHTATVGFHVNQYPVTIRGSLNQVIHLPYPYTQSSLKVLRYSNVPLPLPLQTPPPHFKLPLPTSDAPSLQIFPSLSLLQIPPSLHYKLSILLPPPNSERRLPHSPFTEPALNTPCKWFFDWMLF